MLYNDGSFAKRVSMQFLTKTFYGHPIIPTLTTYDSYVK